MTLEEINKKWIAYKEKYNLNSSVLIEEVRFDAAKGADSSFDYTELLSDQYILHLNDKIALYRTDYVDYILCHEFTHLYDFLTQPYAYKVMRKLYLFMNTYSEYHAARRSLGMILQEKFSQGIDAEKCVIPTAYREISLRRLVSDTLRQAELAGAYFRQNTNHQTYHVYLRYIMYIMGYASHFSNKKEILRFCLEDLGEDVEKYLEVFRILEEKDFFKIEPLMEEIYKREGI